MKGEKDGRKKVWGNWNGVGKYYGAEGWRVLSEGLEYRHRKNCSPGRSLGGAQSRLAVNSLSSIISTLVLLQSTRRHQLLPNLIQVGGIDSFPFVLVYKAQAPFSSLLLPLPVCGRRASLSTCIRNPDLQGKQPVRASAAGTVLTWVQGKHCPVWIVRMVVSFSFGYATAIVLCFYYPLLF